MQTVRDTGGTATCNPMRALRRIEQVALSRSTEHLNGGQQLMDLDGDGRTDLVQFAVTAGWLFAQTGAGAWQPFVPFHSQPNLDWNDPNLRMSS